MGQMGWWSSFQSSSCAGKKTAIGLKLEELFL
jgi:hypothetical protein